VGAAYGAFDDGPRRQLITNPNQVGEILRGRRKARRIPLEIVIQDKPEKAGTKAEW